MANHVMGEETASSSCVSKEASSSSKPKETKNTATAAATAHVGMNDAATTPLLFVDEPEEMDVLCGHDKTFNEHPGNKAYRDMITLWAEMYRDTKTKQSKMCVTSHVCKFLKTRYNARFLKPTTIPKEEQRRGGDGGGGHHHHHAFRWEVLTDQAARDKISHALRTSVSSATRIRWGHQKDSHRRRKVRAAKKEQQHQQQQQHIEQKQQQQQQQIATTRTHPQMMDLPQRPNHPFDEHRVARFSFPNTHGMHSFTTTNEVPSHVFWPATTSHAQATELHNFEPLPLLSSSNLLPPPFSSSISADPTTLAASSSSSSMPARLFVRDSCSWQNANTTMMMHDVGSYDDFEPLEPLGSIVTFNDCIPMARSSPLQQLQQQQHPFFDDQDNLNDSQSSFQTW